MNKYVGDIPKGWLTRVFGDLFTRCIVDAVTRKDLGFSKVELRPPRDT